MNAYGKKASDGEEVVALPGGRVNFSRPWLDFENFNEESILKNSALPGQLDSRGWYVNL